MYKWFSLISIIFLFNACEAQNIKLDCAPLGFLTEKTLGLHSVSLQIFDDENFFLLHYKSPENSARIPLPIFSGKARQNIDKVRLVYSIEHKLSYIYYLDDSSPNLVQRLTYFRPIGTSRFTKIEDQWKGTFSDANKEISKNFRRLFSQSDNGPYDRHNCKHIGVRNGEPKYYCSRNCKAALSDSSSNERTCVFDEPRNIMLTASKTFNSEFVEPPYYSYACNFFVQSKPEIKQFNIESKLLIWFVGTDEISELDAEHASCFIVDGFDYQLFRPSWTRGMPCSPLSIPEYNGSSPVVVEITTDSSSDTFLLLLVVAGAMVLIVVFIGIYFFLFTDEVEVEEAVPASDGSTPGDQIVEAAASNGIDQPAQV